MKPSKKYIKEITIDYDCDTQGCVDKVEVQNDGVADENGKYKHSCPGCGAIYFLDKSYPYTDFEEVIIDI